MQLLVHVNCFPREANIAVITILIAFANVCLTFRLTNFPRTFLITILITLVAKTVECL